MNYVHTRCVRLFEANSTVYTPNNPRLAGAIQNYASTSKSDNDITQRVPRTGHNVLNGGGEVGRGHFYTATNGLRGVKKSNTVQESLECPLVMSLDQA